MVRYSLAERAYLRAASTVVGRTRAMGAERDFYALHRVEVGGVRDVAPFVRRLTLRGSALTTYRPLGADEYVGLVMPPAGLPLVLPQGHKLNLRAELAAMPEAERPDLRWYTVRHHRADLGEVDVDLVLHDAGPGGAFLRRVQVGDEVGLREGNASYQPPDAGTHQLLVADETALPALGAIADAVRGTAVADHMRALVEVPTRDHAAPLDADFDITWFERGTADPGSLLLPELERMVLPPLGSAWACGEQSLAAGVRRHLVRERHVDRTAIAFFGYWRLGAART